MSATRRKVSTISDSQRESSGTTAVSMPMRNPLEPSADDLINEAVKFGYLDKRNNSMLAYFFPCLFPRWKKRYFILVGNYLFRYSSESGESPKGVPIPLDSVVVRQSELENCFEVAMIRKVYTMRAASADECRSWMKAINDRKGGAIREHLGHVATSTTMKTINKAGASLFKSTLRKDSSGLNDTMNPMQTL